MRDRMRRGITLLLVGSVLGSGGLVPLRPVRAGPAKTVPNRPYPEEFRAGVREAVRKGIQHLQEGGGRLLERSSDAAWFEQAAEVRWVLRRAGVQLEYQADEENHAILARHTPGTVEEASLLVLALCAQPLPAGDPFAPLDSQPGVAPVAPLSKEDRPLVERAVALLLKQQVLKETLPPGAKEGLPADWRFAETRGGWGGVFPFGEGTPLVATMAGTVHALLALDAASRAGVEVPHERFLAALDLLLRWQAPEGRNVRLRLNEVRGDRRSEWISQAKARGYGWTGTSWQKPSGSSTVGAAIGLVICKDALRTHGGFTPALRRRTDVALRDALAWIQKHFTVRKDPEPCGGGIESMAAEHRYRWLLGLAQLGVRTGMRLFGGRDWYGEGAEALLTEQAANGAWEAPWRSRSRPMLFLLRAGSRSVASVLPPSE